ncbi:uncharacterized protein LOC132458745 [Gadus macrocephalus]|uniref:uncharacterized protein LOC132458745 n=1 Tax=Gadus macrocephalus TaxID=80720 RepID=UPI0028CBA4B6|nr:uncharacterized protein LOC132458745 [Gadus macrocephalus]
MKTLAASTTGSEADQPASAAIKTPVVSPDISDHHGATRSTQASSEDYWTTAGRAHKLPPNVDTDVFRELPEDIQKELLSPAFTRTHPTSSASATSRPVPTPLPLYYGPDRDPASQSQPPLRSSGDSHPLPIRVGSYLCSSDALSTTTEVSRTPPGRTSTGPGEPPAGDPQRAGGQALCSPCGVPGDVDPAVFSELPLEIQRELMVGWRQQKPLLKAPSSERKSSSKYKKAAVKGGRQNDLYKYFKAS